MSASITTRATSGGEKRYLVRYRLGGRAWPVRNAGTFATMKEARARRDLVAGEIAAGRDPGIMLAALGAPPLPMKTFRTWAAEYEASRIDAAEETRRGIRARTGAMMEKLGDVDPSTITPQMVADLVASLELKPSSLRRYVSTLRAVLDYAGVDPNPARDRRVRLPREEHVEIEPPSSADVALIVTHSPRRWRLALQTLTETGMRAGELHQLEWRDVDTTNSRFRIRSGKTRAARRWVSVPGALLGGILDTCPPDDRTAERRVFVGATPGALRNAMWRACRAAGIALYSPHDLRHRYASVQVDRGEMTMPELAAQLGHARKTLTLDTYSHVLLHEDES